MRNNMVQPWVPSKTYLKQIFSELSITVWINLNHFTMKNHHFYELQLKTPWSFWAWSGLRSLNSDRFPMSGPSGTEGTIYKSHVTTVEFPPCTANPFGSSFGGSAGFSAAFFGAALFHRGGSGAAEDGAAASLWEQHNSLLQWQTEQIMCKAVLVNWALISNLRLCRWQMSQRLKHFIANQSASVSI